MLRGWGQNFMRGTQCNPHDQYSFEITGNGPRIGMNWHGASVDEAYPRDQGKMTRRSVENDEL